MFNKISKKQSDFANAVAVERIKEKGFQMPALEDYSPANNPLETKKGWSSVNAKTVLLQVGELDENYVDETLLNPHFYACDRPDMSWELLDWPTYPTVTA